jgi:GT2 family glycosyltransferase
MTKVTLTVSIVVFKNNFQELTYAVKSVLASSEVNKLFIIDNSPTDDLKRIAIDSRIEYLFVGKNLGFGKAHNLALKKAAIHSQYHLILNPDVEFNGGILSRLILFMDRNRNVGLVQPKILNPDKTLQYVYKRLPSPSDLIFRRFLPSFLMPFFQKRVDYYEMRSMNFNVPLLVPSLSGCFMFFRMEHIVKVGFFDEQFFMYLEDIDLSRRMFSMFNNVYYPDVQIFHAHARESYGINKLLAIHVVSAIKYFNKWGWFFDAQRDRANRNVTEFKG